MNIPAHRHLGRTLDPPRPVYLSVRTGTVIHQVTYMRNDSTWRAGAALQESYTGCEWEDIYGDRMESVITNCLAARTKGDPASKHHIYKQPAIMHSGTFSNHTARRAHREHAQGYSVGRFTPRINIVSRTVVHHVKQ